jgi:hypothetical protein
MLKFFLTLALLKSGFDVKNFITNLLSVHFLGGFLSTFWSIFEICLWGITVANECILTIFVLLHIDGGNITKNLKSFFYVGLCPFIRNVLNKNVIILFSKFCLWFWLELHCLKIFFVIIFSDSFISSFWILKADISLASGWVIFIEWNFTRDNFTIFWEI